MAIWINLPHFGIDSIKIELWYENNNRITDFFITYAKLIKYDKNKNNDETCPICFENYHNKSKIYKLSCGHYFDSRCIMSWFLINNTCPLCRKILFSVVIPTNFYFFKFYLDKNSVFYFLFLFSILFFIFYSNFLLVKFIFSVILFINLFFVYSSTSTVNVPL